MTSTTFSARRHPLRSIFLHMLKNNALAILLASILSVLINPVMLFTEYSKSFEYYLDISQGIELSFMKAPKAITSDKFQIIALIAAALIIVFACIGFRYIHSRTANDWWNCLPVSRKGLFLTITAVVYVSAAIPVTVSFIAELIASFFVSWELINPAAVLGSFLIFLILIFVCVAFTALLCVICGNTFNTVISLLVVNICWPYILSFFKKIIISSLRGFMFSEGSNFDYILSPFGKLFYSGTESLDGTSAFKIIITYSLWLLYGALILTLAVFLNKKHKNEHSGYGFEYKIIPTVLSVLTSALFGIITAYMFSRYSIDEAASNAIFTVFFTVGALVTSILFGAIISRGFQTLLRSLITGMGVIIVGCGALLIIYSGCFGYVTRIPDPSEVESVDFSIEYYDSTEGAPVECIFDKADNIDTINMLHNRIVYSQRGDGYNITCTIKYKLTDGKSLTRAYNVYSKHYTLFLERLYNSTEFREHAQYG